MERRRRLVRLAAAAAVALVVAGGASACDSGPLASPAAEVGDRTVERRDLLDQIALQEDVLRKQAKAQDATDEQLDSVLGQFTGAGADTIPTTTTSQALTTLVQLEILREAVAQGGGEVTDEMRATARDSVTQSLQQQGVDTDSVPKAYLDQQAELSATQTALRDVIDVSDEEVQAAYDAQVDDYAQICVSVIVTADEAAAAAARDRILGGEAFADVAQEVSTDQATAAAGGAAGCAATADVVPSFGDAVRDAEVDVPLEPYESTGGWLVTAVTSRTVPTLDELRAELTPDLQSQKVGEVVQPIVEATTIDPRYGTWDATTASVVAPAGS
ncbi:MAG TPA: peptidylprolyl isomerase [Aquihabitans sp.]|nr:peptidylprolyl isomerase [Aquihabitans sp.]